MIFNNFFDYNTLENLSFFSKLKSDQSFSLENIEIGSNFENINEMAYEWKMIYQNILEEKNEYFPKLFKDNHKMNFNFSFELNHNSSLDNTNENELNLFLDKSNQLIDEKMDNYYKHKKERIFEIIRANNKVGRMKKNSKVKGIHNNFSQDNIIGKIKRRFIEKLRIYINNKYKNYLFKKSLKKHKNNNWLKKVEPKITLKIKKEENLKWFETKIYKIFSENISSRYSKSSNDLNKGK